MSRRLPASLLLIAAACSRPTTPPPAPAPAPAAPESARVARPDTMVSYRVPSFRPLPLVRWGAPPAGEPHAPRARTYDLQHQVVRVRFDWARHAVVGSTTLTLAALDSAIGDVRLDAVAMTIRAVRDARGRALRYDYDGHTLDVRLPRRLAPHARTSIAIDYETVKPKKGAYFIDRRHVVWTQGEMIDTRWWIPTYDEPNDKTTWEMYIRTARTERALSNGRLAGSRPVDGGIEWHWVLDRPASTYLMTAVTGDYAVLEDRWRDVPIGYWTYPDSVQAAWRGFGSTPRAVRLFSARTGVDYPWVKYDQVVAPDYIFGGMENVTATTQADDDILHPAWAEPQANAEGLVAHELGHQWYGDLLTTADWANAWLNEGFATFMEQTYQEAVHGAAEGAYDRLEAQEETIAADERARRPLVWSRWAVDPLELFLSGHIYPRGASVLQMLRHQLGDSLFWAAMHHYTTAHAYGNVVSDDLRAAFEQATGRDFSRFFAQWVYGAGVPQFQVSYAYDSTTRALTLTARQVQPRDSLTGLFDADVDVQVLTDAGAVNGVVPVHGEMSSATFRLPAAPRSIRWNEGGWLLEVHDFPRPTVMLAWQLAHDADPIGRIEAVDLLRERPAEERAADAVAAAARGDRFWGVRQRATEALAAFPESAAVPALLAASADVDARVRESAAAALASFGGARVRERLRALAATDSSLYVRGQALRSYASVGGDDALELIRQALGRDSWLDIERTQAVMALRFVSVDRAWPMVLPYLSFSVDRHTRQAAIGTLVALSKGREAEAAAAIAPVLSAPDFYSRATAAAALGRLGQPSSVEPLEARRRVEAESRVINAIDAAVASIRGH
ncbi:MAG TPA: M1 family metallopeptidase [Gemmatimonadaceae bacterium]|nr:M1 family metallopeptidase [Gemmatimonadaceae bacterium]